jgi:hypothetical protein
VKYSIFVTMKLEKRGILRLGPKRELNPTLFGTDRVIALSNTIARESPSL